VSAYDTGAVSQSATTAEGCRDLAQAYALQGHPLAYDIGIFSASAAVSRLVVDIKCSFATLLEQHTESVGRGADYLLGFC
jgi:hypothetical protein